jgi:hypothetical protein
MPKPSYVGPKKVQLSLCAYNLIHDVVFPTSIAYHRFVKDLTSNTDDVVEVWNGVERINVSLHAVDAVAFPLDQLVLRKASKSIIKLSLIFESGKQYSMHLTGDNRLRIVYKKLLDRIGATPSRQSFIEIHQEENKVALVRHSEVIVGIVSSKVKA